MRDLTPDFEYGVKKKLGSNYIVVCGSNFHPYPCTVREKKKRKEERKRRKKFKKKRKGRKKKKKREKKREKRTRVTT